MEIIETNMPDSLLVGSSGQIERSSISGLRRRYQADASSLQRNSEEDDSQTADEGEGEVGDGDAGNRDEDFFRNNGTDISSQQASTTSDDDDDDNRTIGTAELPSSRINPLSGSIGIGEFRISRLYCFLSIISALGAIVLAPLPTNMIQYPGLARMVHEATDFDYVRRHSIESIAMTDDRLSERDADESEKIIHDKSHLMEKRKKWSVEEIIARVNFIGVGKSQKPVVASKNNNKEGGKDQRKRGRRPAEKHYNEMIKNARGLVSELDFFWSRKKEKSEDNDQSGYPREWMERINRLMNETLSDIIQRRKKKLGMTADRKVRWTGSIKNDKTFANKSNNHERNSRSLQGSHDVDARGDIDDKWQWIDPILLEYGSLSSILTNVIDKILKSTIRLCIITNFMLTMTYLLHSAVAAWFLSYSDASERPNITAATRRLHETHIREDPNHMVSEWSFASSSGATSTRERMGGFLIFKLLLISAVLSPDMLDLMILVTWFTLLGCLRSLDHLAHSTNLHLAAMGQPPKKGTVQILFWVLLCDVVAAGSCVALFHTAGFGMVMLLTCDCALLGTDAVSHILKYYQHVLENYHDGAVRDLEERQLHLGRTSQNSNAYDDFEDGEETQTSISLLDTQERHPPAATTTTPTALRRESESLDRQMEDLELVHRRRLSILDTSVFCLDMTCHILTVAHFAHIWTINGVQFTLIDGVLALHLHSAISSACAKLARRRNVHNIARDLEHFSNATDEELKRASADGDVCCICLGSMTKGGNVKKVYCGHIYHTHCLKEVIERAQNLQSAKCPLCRAPLVSEKCHPITNLPRRNDNYNFIRQNNIASSPPQVVVEPAEHTLDSEIAGDSVGGNVAPIREGDGERALFRFSTEEILPIWLPLPAFSFEVVRRPPLGPQRPMQQQNQPVQSATPLPTERMDQIAPTHSNRGGSELEAANEMQGPQSEQQDTQLSFLQRILLFTGLVPMSPEEEARALAQLVDMFPQYDHNVLSRELRNRGSLEAVTEAILIGILPEVPGN